MVKLWIDDIREKPKTFDVWAKNYEDAIVLLKTKRIKYVSFDHDLGEEKTGYDIAKWIEQQAFLGKIPPLKWKIHSANPIGRENIKRAMESAERFWNK